MKSIALITAMAAATLATDIQAQTAGLSLIELDMSHHGRSAEMAIWYPGTGDGTQMTFASNPVFQGVPAMQGATLASGDHPVILLSHGFGGGLRSVAWMAQGLAERGAIVVTPYHINTTWSAFDVTKSADHWTRAQDMTVALDHLMAVPIFAEYIDADRIMAAGFSYGGWTALSLGGATGNLYGMVDTCLTYIEDMSHCDLLLSPMVGLQDRDPVVWNASYRDARVTHVAALDPGFVWGMTAGDLSGLDANVQLIGFGMGDGRMIATDFDRSGLTDLLPDAGRTVIEAAHHFTMMPLCTDAGVAILESENDDPVCTDPVGTDRAAVHAKVIDLIARQLGL